MKHTPTSVLTKHCTIKHSALLLGLLISQASYAEISLALFAGQSMIDNGDLNLKQASTDMNFHNVSWNDRSFEEPIFYGAKLGYWFTQLPNWGISVDFSHLKNYLNYNDTVSIDGVRNGIAVSGKEPISATIQDFNMSHGLNTLTFNGMYRWFPTGQRDQSFLGRMQLYSGLGAGFSIPHVEATVGKDITYEYQWGAGPAVNGMMGINYDVYKFLSGFVEYKLTYADVEAELNNGGTINTETVNHQIIFGLAAHFDL
jgi:hypothetical protein